MLNDVKPAADLLQLVFFVKTIFLVMFSIFFDIISKDLSMLYVNAFRICYKWPAKYENVPHMIYKPRFLLTPA